MEGLPRLPMLSCDQKFSMASVDFGPKIKQYIDAHFDEDSSKYESAVGELNALRERACRSVPDPDSAAALKRYFCQLYMLKSRVPMEPGDEAAVVFTWMDKCYDMPNPVAHEDVNYEMACVMHNLAAVHAQIACAETRISVDSIKKAFSHLQCAAWSFEYVRDHLGAAAFSVDFDKSVLGWYAGLMLTQAQECILEKSLIDHRKHSIVAKIAAHCADGYAQRLAVLDAVSDVAAGAKSSEWRRMCGVKRDFYSAVKCLCMGMAADDEQRMGDRLAWYSRAVVLLESARKLAAKTKNAQLKEAIAFAADVIGGKQQNAQKENDFIYHEKVMAADALPEVQGVSLVKPIGFDPLDESVGGVDLFAGLVPFGVLSSSSVYSEEKAKLLRSVTERVDEKNAALESFMASLQLDRLALTSDVRQQPLPEILLERSAAFNAQPNAVPALLDSLQRLTSCYQESDGKLSQLERLAERLVGVLAELPAAGEAAELGKSLERIGADLRQYRQAHQKATASNAELQRAVAVHSENLNVLAMPLHELRSRLPAPDVCAGDSDEGVELKRILDKVTEMTTQRQSLLSQLRKQIQDDDLTKRLLSERSVDSTELFERELKKYDGQRALMDQNLAAQANILSALTEANAQYAERRRDALEAMTARDKTVMALVGAYDIYVDVQEKAERGRLFYQRYLEKLRSLEDMLDTCESAVQVLGEEHEQLKARSLAESRARQQRDRQPSPLPPLPSVAVGGGGAAPPSRQRPRLGDYLDYYRSKQSAGPPPAAVSAGPAAGYLQAQSGMPANMAAQTADVDASAMQYIGTAPANPIPPSNIYAQAQQPPPSVPFTMHSAPLAQMPVSQAVPMWAPAAQVSSAAAAYAQQQQVYANQAAYSAAQSPNCYATAPATLPAASTGGYASQAGLAPVPPSQPFYQSASVATVASQPHINQPAGTFPTAQSYQQVAATQFSAAAHRSTAPTAAAQSYCGGFNSPPMFGANHLTAALSQPPPPPVAAQQSSGAFSLATTAVSAQSMPIAAFGSTSAPSPVRMQTSNASLSAVNGSAANIGVAAQYAAAPSASFGSAQLPTHFAAASPPPMSQPTVPKSPWHATGNALLSGGHVAAPTVPAAAPIVYSQAPAAWPVAARVDCMNAPLVDDRLPAPLQPQRVTAPTPNEQSLI